MLLGTKLMTLCLLGKCCTTELKIHKPPNLKFNINCFLPINIFLILQLLLNFSFYENLKIYQEKLYLKMIVIVSKQVLICFRNCCVCVVYVLV